MAGRASWGRSAGALAACIVTVTLIWASEACSLTRGKPTGDRIANIQILGVNDFHGNLEPPRTVNGRTVGGAADHEGSLETESGLTDAR